MYGGFKCESLILPPHVKIGEVYIGLDIGGTLAKIAYVDKIHDIENGLNSTRLHLQCYNADDTDEYISCIHNRLMLSNQSVQKVLHGTGTGCMKYRERLEKSLMDSDVRLEMNADELALSVKGWNFLWQSVSPSLLLQSHSPQINLKHHCHLQDSGLLPCLLVNIGSAMTICRVNQDGSTKVVGGGTRGGLTFLGLGALLTGAKSFDELIKLAERGNSNNVDLLLSDTAGGSYNQYSKQSLVASFGKAAKQIDTKTDQTFNDADIASSTLSAILNDIASTAALVAKVQSVTTVCFCGSFVQGNVFIMEKIEQIFNSTALWIEFELNPVFLRYDAYFGAIGSLLHGEVLSNGCVET